MQFFDQHDMPVFSIFVLIWFYTIVNSCQTVVVSMLFVYTHHNFHINKNLIFILYFHCVTCKVFVKNKCRCACTLGLSLECSGDFLQWGLLLLLSQKIWYVRCLASVYSINAICQFLVSSGLCCKM